MAAMARPVTSGVEALTAIDAEHQQPHGGE